MSGSSSRLAAIILSSVFIGWTPVAIAAPFDTVELSEGAVSLSQYDAVYIAPVSTDLDIQRRRVGRITSAGRGASTPVSEKERARKADDLHKQLVEAFSKRVTVVDTPSEGVLTIETNITRLLATRPTFELLSQEPTLDFTNSVFAGGAAMDFLLSENGQVVAKISEEDLGSFNDGFPRNVTWQDADRVFRRTARNLAKYVRKN